MTRMRIVERSTVVSALVEYGRDCDAGEGRLVLMSGEAGVGKSTALEQFAQAIPDARWLLAGCDGLSTPRPLGPLFDIADQLGGDLQAACRSGAGRDELFAVLLREIERPRGLTVLAIEDIHWADESTLDLIRYLGRRIRDTSVLVITTYRDDGLAPKDPLRIVLGDAATQRTTRRISVAPLSEEAVAVLAADSNLDPAELYRLTGGNPFFLTEIMLLGTADVPPSARDAVLARIAVLTDDARQTVQAAALIGSHIDAELLAAVAAASADVLDELVTAGVLVSDNMTLRFRHEITRLAVEQQISAHRRRPIHAVVLAALLAVGCDEDARLAYHAEGAGDSESVLRFAARAAERAADLAAHREAAAQYERALRFSQDAEPEVIADLNDRLALETALIDRWQDAADARERALQLWRQTGNRLREGDTLRRLSRTMWRLCRGKEAGIRADEAIAALEPLGPTAELAWAYANLANHLLLTDNFDAGRTAAHRAEELAEKLDLPAAHSDALNSEGCILANTGGDWENVLDRALTVALNAGAAEQAGRAYSNSYVNYATARRFADAERYYVDGSAYCYEHDISTYLTCLRGHRTSALVATGDWDEAVHIGRSLLDSGASPVNRISSLVSVGTVLARRDGPSAWALLDEALGLALGTNEATWISFARLARVEAYWFEDRTAELAAELAAVHPYALQSDDWEAGQLATWLRRSAVNLPDPDVVAAPYMLALAGDFDAASQAWSELGCPYDAALALFDSGTEEGLRQALSRFDALGADAAVQATRRAMRQLGVRSIPAGTRSTTRSHPHGLTQRENDVLELIRAKHTNAEIAAKLFISTKTVDHHVSAVLAKLGVSTRAQAAAATQPVRSR